MWDKGGYFRVDDRGERRKEENKKVTPRQCQSGKRWTGNDGGLAGDPTFREPRRCRWTLEHLFEHVVVA